MTLQEILAAQGMDESKVAATLAAMKENKIFIANEENLDVRYAKLKGDYDGQSAQLTEARKSIEEMKANAAGYEALQAQSVASEAKYQELLKENERLKVENAVKVGLLEAKASDVDYMTFKLKEKGEISLDENGKIKGWDDMITGLKTQFPQQFETSSAKKVEENKLKTGDGSHAITKNELLRMPYAERAQIFADNPEAYKEAMKS